MSKAKSGKDAIARAPFQFSQEQRKWIADALHKRRFEAVAIDCFLAMAEMRVDRWRRYLPAAPGERNRDGREALKRLDKYLNLALHELRRLPLAWSTPLWIALEEQSTPDSADVRIALTHERAKNFLDHALGAVEEHLLAYEAAGGRDFFRKSVLVAWIAEAYQGALERKPSATAEGPFMEVMRAIGEAAGMTIGKDTIAATIKAPAQYLRYLNVAP